jgi:hypothetical protein
MVFCPIFNHEIADGLCWDISNIGNDSLMLPPEKTPPCGWDEAHEICLKCQHYADWD